MSREGRLPPLLLSVVQTRHRERRKNVDDAITRAEHEEFRKRLEEQNQRQDKRISLLEESVRKIGALTTSVEKLALSMESMAKEQERQGERMEVLEGRDGEMWRKVVGYIATAVIGIVLGFVFTQIDFYPRPLRGGRQQKQRQNLYFQTNYTTFCTNLEEP